MQDKVFTKINSKHMSDLIKFEFLQVIKLLYQNLQNKTEKILNINH